MTHRNPILAVLTLVLMATTTYAPPAVLVTNLEDAGAGSLREAISNAVAGNTIVFSPDLSGKTILLSGPHLVVNKDLIISAAGLPGGVTISGGGNSRILEVTSDRTLTLDSLTLVDGKASGSYPGGFGGAIYVNFNANLNLNRCSLSGNTADGRGGAIFCYPGGSLILNQCTLSGNSSGDIGGAISNEGTATLKNCTMNGNGSLGLNGFAGRGGAIFNFDQPLVLNHCTIVGNLASESGGGIRTQGGSVTLHNTIIAGNTAGTTAGSGPDIRNSGTSFSISGANLIGNNDTVEASFPAGPLVGTAANPLDPQLSPLDNYGGLTMTLPPLATSPAIDASSSGLDIDQRGVPRPQGAAFDIGAVEAVSLAISASAGAVQVTLPTIPSPPHLQASSALEGPWSYVLDTSSQQSYPLATGSPSMYFRLIAEGPAEEGQLGVDKEPLRHRHLAVILIDFPDTPSEVKAASFPTPAEMQKILFNDRLVPYLSDMSYGNFSISGDVFGYFTHQNPGYVEGSIVEVEQVVLIDSIVIPNFDITQYDGVVLVSVHEKGLSGARGGDSPWMSLTINGSPVSTSGIFSPLMVGFSSSPIEWMIPTGPDSSLEDTSTIQLNRFDRTFAHELFHYLGLLWHANSRTNGEFYDYEPEVPGNYQSGTSFPLLNWEYGNYFDVLGKSFYGVSLNASQRDYLGWSNSLNRSSIKGYGRYLARIHPLNSTTGIRMVEVRIPYQYNDFAELLGRKNRGYFLEVRTGDSEWDNMLMHPQLIENNEGIMVNKTDGASSQLLDMSPSPNFPFYGQTVPDLRDVVLKPGMVYENDEVRFSNVVKSPDGSFTVEIEVKRPSDK